MRNIFKFARPKGPGYGISSHYYLSLLATTPVLPPILSIINPTGEGGAVEGFGAPLSDEAPIDALSLPLSRGGYVIASKDKKTVLKLLIFSKDEVGFNPEEVALHSASLGVSGELLNRIRATWTIGQIRFESHDADVAPSLDFCAQFCLRFGLLAGAAIADPLSERYLMPENLGRFSSNASFTAAPDYIVVKSEQGVLETRGLLKFALPELRISGVLADDQMKGQAMLLTVAQTVLDGAPLKVGAVLGGFRVQQADSMGQLLELIPTKGDMHAALS